MEQDADAIVEHRPDVGHCFGFSHYRYSASRLSAYLVNGHHEPVRIICYDVCESVWLESPGSLNVDLSSDRKPLVSEILRDLAYEILVS